MTLPPRKKPGPRDDDKVTLKTIADHLGLTPGTVSAALNNSPAARSIPDHTKNRIIEAAQALNYRPNFFARTLRLKRTYTIGVIAEEIGDAYGSMVISGIEEFLRKNNYFFLTVIHRHDARRGGLHHHGYVPHGETGSAYRRRGGTSECRWRDEHHPGPHACGVASPRTSSRSWSRGYRLH